MKILKVWREKRAAERVRKARRADALNRLWAAHELRKTIRSITGRAPEGGDLETITRWEEAAMQTMRETGGWCER